MRQFWLVSVVLGITVVTTASAQVSITGQQSNDKSVTGLQINVGTMDRTVVPLTVETKETKVNDTTTRSESVTRARLGDGSYFDLITTTATTSQPNPNTTETVIETVEKDRQGGERATRRVTTETNKTAAGEQSNTSTYRRDSSGKLVLEGQIASTTRQNPDGSLSTITVEKRTGGGGALQPQRRIEQTTVESDANTKQVVSKIMTPNHMDGGLSVTSRETATIRTDGNTTSTEVLIQSPSGTTWQNVGKVLTTETRDPNGSVRRETIEEGQSQYAPKEQPVGSLVPQRKIVETEVRKPDGTVVMERNAYRRDVNGEWKPTTFSVETAAQPIGY
ncbi:MAG TPA: hypothetical protein VLZ12_15900 [Verrucomicrobiae bacterium]|nr:hypothetical protein [Verrucomicrobiae bacterium]